MSSDLTHSSSQTLRQREAPVCTRSGSYRPAPPEELGALSRLMVKLEVGLIVATALALGVALYLAQREDKTPIKVANYRSSGSILSSLPANFGAVAESSGLDGADPGKGQALYMQTCTACHGQNLQGMPHQGVSLVDNKFINTTSDRKLVAFLKVGRTPADPKSTTKLLMPARGGNPALDDDGLASIVAFLRQAQKEPLPAGETQQTASATQPATAADARSAGANAGD